MRTAAAIALGLLASSASLAQPGRITSAYTRLNLDACVRLDRGEEPQSASWRCRGYGGLPLYVQNGDDRYDVDAALEDNDALWGDAFNYPGETVEWRLFNGTPFAIVYRLRTTDPQRPAASRLIVESVGRAGQPGCRVAQIEASITNANVRAREAADALLRRRAVCLQPE